MRITRPLKAVGLIASASLALAACGSDQNVSGGDAAKAENVACEGKDSIAGEGSTAQENAMGEFIKAYGTTCEGKKLDYTGTGSGDGVSKFIEGKIDFAGSDSPLDAEEKEVADAKERCGSDAWHVPAVFGPVAVAYNVEGVDKLALDGPTTAKIFSGKIKTWNDPAIAKLNKGVKLPSDKIKVTYRSDESGTTDNFQKYLETAAPKDWKKGDGKTFNGGVGDGKAKSSGVGGHVKQTEGAITYVEWSFAKSNKLGIADLANSGKGDPVELTAESAAKAIDKAEIKGKGEDLVLDLDSIYGTKTEGAYPLTLATYEIVCSDYEDDDTGKAVKAFLNTVISNAGQDTLEGVGYIPLPEQFKTKLEKTIEAIQ